MKQITDANQVVKPFKGDLAIYYPTVHLTSETECDFFFTCEFYFTRRAATYKFFSPVKHISS